MANYNKIMLMGNLTRDPQLSYLPSQTAVVEFGLAINRKWTSKDGERKEEICFVDCRAFGRTAENLNKYMSKGRPLFVEGRLTYDAWTAQDGTKRSKHRVTVDNFQFIDSGRSQGGGPSGGPSGGQGESNSGQSYSPPPQQSPNDAGPAGDDIPF